MRYRIACELFTYVRILGTIIIQRRIEWGVRSGSATFTVCVQYDFSGLIVDISSIHINRLCTDQHDRPHLDTHFAASRLIGT
jgi:hypothetical protein